MAQVRAAHILVKHRGSRNPVSRRTHETITRSKEDAMLELAAIRGSIIAAPDKTVAFKNEAARCDAHSEK